KAEEVRLDVRLARSGVVRVRLTDAKGNVARFVSVAIADAKGAGPAWGWRYANPQGTAFVLTEMSTYAGPAPSPMMLSEAEGRIEGLPAGKYVLHVKDGDATK